MKEDKSYKCVKLIPVIYLHSFNRPVVRFMLLKTYEVKFMFESAILLIKTNMFSDQHQCCLEKFLDI